MPRTRLHSAEPQPVSFVELFFDLVFVFAVTQMTVLAADDLTIGGSLRAILLFWLIWWAWTQFTWTLSPADTGNTIVRVCTLLAAGAAFVMAASVPRAFQDDPFGFALPYLLIRLAGMGLQVRIDHESTDTESAVSRTWISLSLVGLVLVFVGAWQGTPARNWLWMAAIGLDLAAAAASSRDAVWDLSASHFSERHALFVIIALGESLVVAATAVAQDERSGALMFAAGASLLVASLLWWTYFGWLKEAMEHRFAEVAPEELGPTARDAFSLLHFPLVCGVIAFAVAVEEIVAHPEHPVRADVVTSLSAGIGLFVGASALAYWRVSKVLLVPRLAALAGTLVVVALVRNQDPVWPLVAVAAGLMVIVVAEGSPERRRPASHEGTGSIQG